MILTDRLREKRTRGGEGVKKAGKSAYVLNGCSLIYAEPLTHVGHYPQAASDVI